MKLGRYVAAGLHGTYSLALLILLVKCHFHKKGCTWAPVQFSRSVGSNSLRPHESQHARPPCPSPTPRVRSNSCPSRQWCHPAISSSVVPFSSCPQSLPASVFSNEAIWSLVPLPFVSPAWTSVSSWFMNCWSLAWRILSITLLVCEMSVIVP